MCEYASSVTSVLNNIKTAGNPRGLNLRRLAAKVRIPSFIYSLADGISWVPQHPLMLPQGNMSRLSGFTSVSPSVVPITRGSHLNWWRVLLPFSAGPGPSRSAVNIGRVDGVTE